MKTTLLTFYLASIFAFGQNLNNYSSPIAQEVSDLVMKQTSGVSSMIPGNVKVPKFLRNKIKSKFNRVAIKRVEQQSPATFFGMKPYNEYVIFINETPVKANGHQASTEFMNLMNQEHSNPVHVITMRDARGGQQIISYIFPPGKLPFTIKNEVRAVGRIPKGTSIYLYAPEYFAEKGDSELSAGKKSSAFALWKKLVAWYPLSPQAIKAKKIMDDERLKEIERQIQPSLDKLEDYLADEEIDKAIGVLTALISKYPDYKKRSEFEIQLDQQRSKKTQLAREERDQKFEDFLSNADQASAKKRWTEAIKQYSAALKIKDSPEVRDKLSVAKKRQGQVRQMKAKKRKEEQLASLVTEGDSYFESGDWVKAIASFKSAKKLLASPEIENKLQASINALASQKGQLLSDIPKWISSGDLDQASSGIQSLKVIDPKHTSISVFNSDLAAKRESMAEELETETVTQLVTNVKTLLKELKVDEADNAIRELARLRPSNPELEGFRMELQIKRKKKKSLEVRKKAERKFKSAKYMADNGQPFKALELLGKIMKDDESNLNAYKLMKKLRLSQEVEDSISSHKEAVLFYEPDLNIYQIQMNSDISKLKGKTINFILAYVYQSLGDDTCLLVLSSNNTNPIFLATIANEKYADFIFRDESLLNAVGVITGVTYYETTSGNRKQALTLDILYVGSFLGN